MKVITPGHVYQVDHLDGDSTSEISFVNRGHGADKEVSDALEKCSDIFRETFHGDIGKEVVWEIDVKMDKEHRKYWKDVTFLMNYNHKMEIGELRYISSGKDVGKATHESNI